MTVRDGIILRNQNMDIRGSDRNGREVLGIAVIPVNCELHIRELIIERSTDVRPNYDGLLHDYTVQANVYLVLAPDYDGKKKTYPLIEIKQG